ncbi:hypothetical protein HYV72_00600, partial [Candidatus Uhrbacteria bacterium]|nr:hypothetical protein [Candidatus Uhrbacteria bacterium]
LIWLTLLVAKLLSLFAPVVAIAFVIMFDWYWMFRVLYFIVYVLHAWSMYREAARQDWMERLEHDVMDWREYYHVIFLPMVKEPLSMVDATLRRLSQCHYPSDRLIIVLAGEARVHDHFARVARLIQKKYGRTFFDVIITEHPDHLSDEMPGKGSNLAWAGPIVEKRLREHRIPFERVMASAFDIDTIAHPFYFSYLTHRFATVKNPLRASYQPVVLYNNNIWESPPWVRISAFGTTFWLFGELARPERLWTFSSHSMPFQMLVDVGYWEKDVVSEDSRIFLQGVRRYRGAYRVEPLYLPVSMDAVEGPGVAKSIWSLYKQQRRWAWGVEHFPYIMAHMWRDERIPRRTRRRLLWNHMEGMFTWATAPIIIFVLGWLPMQMAATDPLVLAHNAPFT